MQIAISQPASALSLTGSITETTCGNDDGAVSTTISGGTIPYTYLWNTGSNTSSLNSLIPGIYTLTVTDNNSCTSSQSYTVHASNALVISLVSSNNVTCFGGNNGDASLSVSGGVAPYSWNWQGGAGSGSSASNLNAGSYNITVTDASGCASFHQVAITQPPLILNTISPVGTICIGETANLTTITTGGVAPYNYLWSNGSTLSQVSVNPVVSSTYMLTVTDANGCVLNSDPSFVNVHQPLSVTANFPDSVCKGSQIAVSLTAAGGDGNYTYNWSNGMNGAANSLTINSDVSLNIIVADGCTTPVVQTQLSITAILPPDINFNLPVQSGCAPLEAQFEVPPGLPSGLSFEWNFGDNFTSSQSSPVHLYTQPGIYFVTLKTSYSTAPDCATLLQFPNAVVVYENPVARFIFDPPAPTLSQPEVFFTDKSTGATNWYWKLGDGTESSDQNPRYAYRDTGAFLVSLRIQSQEGCTDSTFNILQVKDEMQVFIPNAFTPDASGVNDYFKIYGVGFVSYELMVFDRWGKQIYYSKNNEQAWDGTDMNTGERVPQGLYVYKVSIIDNAGNVHNRFNHVTVLR